MAIRWAGLLVALWLFCFDLSAEETANNVTVPDPVSLDADWWSYFAADDKLKKAEFDERIDNALKQLNQSTKGVTDKQRNVLNALIAKINQGLKQYSVLRDSAPDSELSIPAAAEKYTVGEALDRFLLWRKIKREQDLVADDLAWQKAQLTLERKQQTQNRNEYLNLSSTDPQRLHKGISLMAGRVSLELSSLQNKRREANSREVRSQASRLKDELDVIHQRLIQSDKNSDKWLKEQLKAEAKANALRAQLTAATGEQMPDTRLGAAKIKSMLLKAAANDIQISINELAARRYKTSHFLSHLDIDAKSSKKTLETLAELSEQYIKLKESIEAQERSWRSLNAQARKYAAAETIHDDQGNTEIAQASKNLLAQVDVTDRLLRDLNLEQDTGEFIQKITLSILKESASWYEGWQLNAESWLGSGWGRISSWLNTSLFEINETPVTTMGLISVLFIITIAWLISRLFRRGLDRLGERQDGVSASALYSLGRVIHYIILIVGIIIGLSSIGIDFTKFALFASALGVGIGFGLQTLIGNFVAGLIILFERSLKVGDFVELSSGLVGEVKEINMRSTLVTTNDNVDILVPNSEFVNSQVTNWTLRDTQRRIHIPFGVAYGTDKDRVKKAVLEAAESVKWTLNDRKNRQPQVWFVEFGESSLNFELVVWLKPEAVKRPSAVQAAYLWEIESKFKEYGIEIPFPQRDLHLRSVFGKKDDEGMDLLKK